MKTKITLTLETKYICNANGDQHLNVKNHFNSTQNITYLTFMIKFMYILSSYY